MLQRVGLAQALLNEPEVVFLDEPMSGLDPLGRREVRELILALRDRGRTVFFSSHILADAEALCSRVAILAGGRLLAAGRLTDMLAFDVQGWEVVVDRRAARLCWPRRPARRRGARGSPTAATRSSCPPSEPPDAARRRLAARGAALVSLNPLRETLEDFFVRAGGRSTAARRAV